MPHASHLCSRLPASHSPLPHSLLQMLPISIFSTLLQLHLHLLLQLHLHLALKKLPSFSSSPVRWPTTDVRHATSGFARLVYPPMQSNFTTEWACCRISELGFHNGGGVCKSGCKVRWCCCILQHSQLPRCQRRDSLQVPLPYSIPHDQLTCDNLDSRLGGYYVSQCMHDEDETT
jgi:hypothetical protein